MNRNTYLQQQIFLHRPTISRDQDERENQRLDLDYEQRFLTFTPRPSPSASLKALDVMDSLVRPSPSKKMKLSPPPLLLPTTSASASMMRFLHPRLFCLDDSESVLSLPSLDDDDATNRVFRLEQRKSKMREGSNCLPHLGLRRRTMSDPLVVMDHPNNMAAAFAHQRPNHRKRQRSVSLDDTHQNFQQTCCGDDDDTVLCLNELDLFLE